MGGRNKEVSSSPPRVRRIARGSQRRSTPAEPTVERDARERLLAEVQANSDFWVKVGPALSLFVFVILWAASGNAWLSATTIGLTAAGEFTNVIATRQLPNVVAAAAASALSGTFLGAVAWIPFEPDVEVHLVVILLLAMWVTGITVSNAPHRPVAYPWVAGFSLVSLSGLVRQGDYATLAVVMFAFVIVVAVIQGERSRRQRLATATESAMFHHTGSIDELTGLMNRRALFERLEASRNAGRGGVYAYLDLDGFKTVNDLHGHRAGDTVLRAVADRLRDHLPSSTIIARIGGDEFVVDYLASATADEAGEQMIGAFATPLTMAGAPVSLSVSVGTVKVPAGSRVSADELLNSIDHAMYESKRAGGHRFAVATLPT